MASFEFLAVVLSVLGLSVSIIYYAFVMQNANKTRQAQLYMGLLNTFRSPQFQNQFHLTESATWEDHDDFEQKYSPENDPEMLSAFTSVFVFYDSVGILVKKNLIDSDLIDGLMALSLVVTWKRCENILVGDREYFQAPMWEDFEYIYNEINQRDKYKSARSPHLAKPNNR